MANHLNVLYFVIIGSILSAAAATEQTKTEPATSSSTEEIIIYEDCVEAHDKTCKKYTNGSQLSDIYNIKTRTERGFSKLRCFDEQHLYGCPGKGWTVVASLVGSQNDSSTAYESPVWTTKNISSSFNAGFWSANVSEVCIHHNFQRHLAIVIPVRAPSLRSLFFEKRLIDMNASDWTDPKSWTPSSFSNSSVSFHDGCYEVGFNVGTKEFIAARIGIVAVNDKEGCEDVPAAAMGVGIYPNFTFHGSGHGVVGEQSILTDTDFFVAVRLKPEPTTTTTPQTSPTTPLEVCTLNGKDHKIGETWNETVCRNCTCQSNLSVTCEEMNCSIVTCSENSTAVHVLGQCCEKCVSGENCASLYKSGVRKDGIYFINPDHLGFFKVRCDMTTDGAGWTVFQKRQDGSEDFFLGWSEYKAGFGDMNNEFWLGLDKIHRLTNSYRQTVLRVDLMDFQNDTAYAEYGTFAVASETESYQLQVSNFSGDAGDSLSYHNGSKFSTRDRDNDEAIGGSCAVARNGAWWYRNCFHSNLNALYMPSGEISPSGISWYFWKRDHRSMKKSEMKIRPAQF